MIRFNHCNAIGLLREMFKKSWGILPFPRKVLERKLSPNLLTLTAHPSYEILKKSDDDDYSQYSEQEQYDD